MQLFDFHTHVFTKEDIEYYIDNKIYALINCSTIKECELVYPYTVSSKYIKMSVGIGPSNCEQVDSLASYFPLAHAIGEIGLDNVWSEKDIDLQKACFSTQLDIAKQLNKPIILHTKGMEFEIAEILSKYDLIKIIHWYSGDKAELEKYTAQGCFFTLGVDYQYNSNSRRVLDYADISKVLTETDALFSIEWVHNKKFDISKIKEQLIESTEFIQKNYQATEDQFTRNNMKIWNQLI